MKKCGRCKKNKPDIHFALNECDYKTGLQNRCRECHAKYYKENKEEIRKHQNEYYKEYYETHKKSILAKKNKRNRERAEQDPEAHERVKQQKREWYAKNKAKSKSW